MGDFFRLKIGAKRQVTFPHLLLERLLLKEGDELEFEVSEGKIEAVRSLKLVPLDYFDEKTLSDLKARATRMEEAHHRVVVGVDAVPAVVHTSKKDPVAMGAAISATRPAYREATTESKKS